MIQAPIVWLTIWNQSTESVSEDHKAISAQEKIWMPIVKKEIRLFEDKKAQ